MDKQDDKTGVEKSGAEARPRRKPRAPEPAPPEQQPAPPQPERQPPATAAEPKPRRPKRPAKPKPPRDRQRAPRPAAPSDPRRAALALLAAVREGATLTEAAGSFDALSPADRARAQRLAATALRFGGRADAVLAPLLHRAPRAETADLLRLAVTEMLALGEAPHGVVNAAVAAARAGGPKAAAAAGMVNAVLRRAAEAQAAWDAAPPTRLPDWLRSPLAARWGEAVAAAIEAAHETAPPIDLTGKPGATLPGEALPTGSHRLPPGARVSTLPGYDSGDWWVQDAAAALPVRLLDPRAGERIADLCAAPGGKTMQIAAAGAQVTAIDLSQGRLERVAENLRRTGLTADLVAADATAWRPETLLDAVLLDAPCSATGTIRRHPELPLIRDGAMIPDLVRVQAALIDHALSLLKPGGRLVYAVCSLHPAEGEAQLAAARTRHPGLVVEPPDLPGLDPAWVVDGAIRTRPDHWADRGGLDGFFIVRLRIPG